MLSQTTTSVEESAGFVRFGGICALLAAVGSLLYSVAFVILKNQLSYSILLAIGGLLTTAVLVALYYRVRASEPATALWALLLGSVAALGSAAHGAYDLANAINPPVQAFQDITMTAPSQIDARGVLTFGLTGIALMLFSWLIVRGGQLPRALGYLGIVLGLLLIEIYLGRLIVLDPTSDLGKVIILGPAALAGLVLNPLFNVLLGLALLRQRAA